ncbi:hypothetical protein [Haloferula sp. BvORR071]|uniref:hypothetical protein n=1 Tax=Haloferula sp. BvORR071 TaxID=1396141 RepID=UPI00054FC36D|nr:hypothetical protein [Haloferula sp. BvORR071]
MKHGLAEALGHLDHEAVLLFQMCAIAGALWVKDLSDVGRYGLILGVAFQFMVFTRTFDRSKAKGERLVYWAANEIYGLTTILAILSLKVLFFGPR